MFQEQTSAFQERALARFDAIVTRLDELEQGQEDLAGKVDRLAVMARAGEEAVTSIMALSRRGQRLENPDA